MSNRVAVNGLAGGTDGEQSDTVRYKRQKNSRTAK